MKEKKIIVSDFDGTITKQDTLFTFLERYADKKWLKLEEMWVNGELGSSECLSKQFALVPDLSEKLIDNFLDTIELDVYFKEFDEVRQKNNIDFLIVSDGLDYFINRILQKNNIKNVKIISNHAEFIGEKFVINFPNKSSKCLKKSGTCKCSVIKKLRDDYREIYYIGDGKSDECVSNKVDYLFAKNGLLNYCKKMNIDCIEYKTYKGVLNYDGFGFNF